MTRVYHEYDMLSGWQEILDPADLDPRATEGLQAGEVDPATWDRYQGALQEYRRARRDVEEALRPISLSEEEAREAACAHDVEKARLAEWVARYDCDAGVRKAVGDGHQCEYRGNDALCSLCGQ